jgi:PhnB protein
MADMNVIPYLTFSGNCEEALKFYEKAFGGKIVHLSRYGGSPIEEMGGNKDWVMHATFEAKGIKLFACDNTKDAPAGSEEGMIQLTINFENAAEQEKVFETMAEEGIVTMPLQDTFWGARFGMLKDKFGLNWMFSCEAQQS